MYLESIAEIRKDVNTLKVDVAKIQQELQDLYEKLARASINNFFVLLISFTHFILLFIYYS